MQLRQTELVITFHGLIKNLKVSVKKKKKKKKHNQLHAKMVKTAHRYSGKKVKKASIATCTITHFVVKNNVYDIGIDF